MFLPLTKFPFHLRLLCGNKFEGNIPSDLGRLNLLSDLQFAENLTLTSATGIGCVNRKFGLW